ncbi:YtxH domain-containing protein [Taibaiella lutea]|uniref:YtxH domain-containing protein n=1 Tax=Taibaiella lutea TaxID=2608001 RepID=A0A5M6CAG5_9BACT|nr:YtxH domain-containing protein [Taibaiella lutea]KAA5532166.1 YtxH domain-containing protein [Taibaiella lutea]
MLKLQQQKRTSSTIPLTVLTGAIVGSAVALLFAPRKGRDFRNDIKGKALELKSRFNNTAIKNSSSDESASHVDIYNKATMHTAKTNNIKEEPRTSKAAAMVNHLKHSKHPGSDQPEIL